MSVDRLRRVVVATPVGQVTFERAAGRTDPNLPVLVALADSLEPVGTLGQRLTPLAAACEAFVANAQVAEATVERRALALSLAIHDAFRGRPVVLVGIGDGGLVAAAAVAPEILRIVAVEPPLRSAKLWPLRARLAERAAADATGPGGAVRRAERDLLLHVYGVGPATTVARDHIALFNARRMPADVVVGSLALMPERPLERLPSVVDEDERRWLPKQPSVSLTVAPGAGHAVMDEAPAIVLDVVGKALAWSRTLRRSPGELARRAAESAPRDVQTLLVVGDGFDTFEKVYAPLNPGATCIRKRGDHAAIDVIVAISPAADDGWLSANLAALTPGGLVLVAGHLGPDLARLESACVEAGLTLASPDPVLPALGSVLVRARKGPQRPAIRVDMIPHARLLMDIRTRLPANALRTDPGLELSFYPQPFRLPPHDGTTVMVLGRPGPGAVPMWRRTVAQAMRHKQILVVEFDDHPGLVSQMMRNEEMPDSGWEMFRVAHGVQTSTAELIDVFAAHNPEVRVFPNAVFSLRPFPAGERPRRVFYGGVTRGPFVVEVAKALEPTIAAYPDTEFHVLGDRAFFDALQTEKKTFRDYLPYEKYLEVMAACSISLSPLKARPMMETKSDAKYIDASRAGVLTIASPTVYERAIRSGENGLIAREIADWPVMLSRMLGDHAARERMARAAWDDVRTNRLFGRQIAQRRAWYQDLIDRREELDRAILQRVPGVGDYLS